MQTMSMEQSGIRELTIADYLAIVMRHKWLIAAITIVVALAAYVWTLRYPPYYKATSEVYINSQNPDLTSSITGITPNNTVTDPDRNVRTQAAIARVPEVADLAVKFSGVSGYSGGRLLTHSHVTPGDGTDLLTFTVTNDVASVAAALAAGYARAFSSYKVQTDTASIVRARNDLKRRLNQLRQAGADGTDTYRQLQQKAQDLTTLAQLQAAPTVVRAPTGADEIAASPMRKAMLGAVLGLMLGLVGAFLLNAFDRRVRDVEEVEHELDVPLLARMPAPRGHGLTILDGPADYVSEAVGRLRTNFDFANSELQAKVVMATSAGSQEGKSTTVANLAIALARAGRHVVVVDLDIRRPSVARLFHVQDRAGATDVATGISDLDAALNPVAHQPLSSRVRSRSGSDGGTGVLEVITAGRTRIDPAELVESPGLVSLLRMLRDHADIVLLDAPPILVTGDAMALTAKVDAMFLVTKLGSVSRPSMRELARGLRTSPAPVLGFVATGAQIDESYLTYGVEPVPQVAGPTSLRVEREPPSELPAASSASGAGSRWTRRPAR
jgi:capsular exopolysaccharide synthesis family protein